ncbi:MAG: nodulation protein NfeD [Elusimicrobia bacterium]|nr:nodulation protein NfeD [Elusimicrobiota bacterium]
MNRYKSLILAVSAWAILLSPPAAAKIAAAKKQAPAAAKPPEGRPPKVLVAEFSGVISPVAAEFLSSAVEEAERRDMDALVLQLDTPGGLDPSMRIIVKAILSSKAPVIAYVHPSGARAASAGVFITMAAHVAAMTPGTNIGAAHPVMIGGGGLPGGGKKEEQDKTMETKVVSDAAAYLKSIAHRRGRNEEWAFEAVSKSTSIPASEAVAMRVVDLEAASLDDLLKALDGRKLHDFDKPLRTAGAAVKRYGMTRRQRWLAALSDPNVAMILMSLGAAGLFIELYNPGLILPGIVGAISLILAFYSFQTLSASYAGVLLILAGLVFFALEIKITSYGLLAVGGIASTLLGALMLFQQNAAGGLAISWSILFSSLAGLLCVVAVVSRIVYKAYRRPVPTGIEGMLGAEGRAVGRLDPRGKVEVGGELWDAESAGGGLEAGAAVVVKAVKGLKLIVAARP